jgi:hypothetical protein
MRGLRVALLVVLVVTASAAAAAAAAAVPPPPPPPPPDAPPPLLTFFGPLRLGADRDADDRTLSALGTWLRLGRGGAGDDTRGTTPAPAWPAPPPRSDPAAPAPPDVIFFSDDDVTCGALADLWFAGGGEDDEAAAVVAPDRGGFHSMHHHHHSPPRPHVRCVDTCVHDAFPRLNMSCVIAQAVDMARTPLLCLINSDIALGDDFLDAARRLFFASAAPDSSSPPLPPPNPRLLMVGRRTDVQLAHGRLDFTDPAWAATLRARAADGGAMHGAYGIDYLVTAAAGFWNRDGDGRVPPALAMPPFLVGVYRWDSYTMAAAIAHPDVAVVDATAQVTALHLQRAAVGREPGHAKRAGSVYADRLVRSLIGTRYLAGHTGNADYELDAEGGLVARF